MSSQRRSTGTEFRILGPLEVWVGGRPLDLGGAKQRLLLAVLILHADEVVTTDRLIDELWHDQPPRTARASLQMHVTGLRRRLGAESARLLTRPNAYLLRVGDSLDLRQFEHRLEEADASEDPADAAARLRDAEALWRGPALADLALEPALQASIARLEELRLVAVERRVDAELAIGRHAALVPELDRLVAEQPFREEFHRQRMLALYRSGRQADALAAYRTAREMLTQQLGIEPTPNLRDLERAILAQEPELDLDDTAREASPAAPRTRTLLAALAGSNADDSVLAFALRLARATQSETLLVRHVVDGGDLGRATDELQRLRARFDSSGIRVRTASFFSSDPPSDLGTLASRLDVELLLSANADVLFAACPSDVAVLVPRDSNAGEGAVLVPFGAGEHDWAAVELGARLALSERAPLRLAGTAAMEETGRRDASVAIADASLAVQYALGVTAEPLLLEDRPQSLLDAAARAGVVVAGVSDRWRQEGIGGFRLALAREATIPMLFVRRGPRPGGLAPRSAATRYTWSLRPLDPPERR